MSDVHSAEKTPCRTPAEGRDGVTNIPTWKFDALRDAILDALTDGPTKQAALKSLVAERLDPDTLDHLGGLGWHVTTVRLQLEVRGEITRVSDTPVVLARTNSVFSQT